MNANLLNIVKQIIAAQGEGILADPPRLRAFFMDLAKDEPKQERLAFGRCIELGSYEVLKNTRTADERQFKKAALADQLHIKTGIYKEWCEGALDMLEVVMFGAAMPTKQEKTAPPKQKAPENRTAKSPPPLSPPRTGRFCMTCGTQLPGEAKFCMGCGTMANAMPVDSAETEHHTFDQVEMTTNQPSKKKLVGAWKLKEIVSKPWFTAVIDEMVYHADGSGRWLRHGAFLLEPLNIPVAWYADGSVVEYPKSFILKETFRYRVSDSTLTITHHEYPGYRGIYSRA